MTPRVFSIRREVQFAETDLAGVLHFSNYFRWLEEVEHAFWRSLGMSVVSQDAERTISWPRVAVECQYFGPARFEDTLELDLRIDEIGARSLRLEVEFRRGTERLALARAKVVCCTMKRGHFRSIPIPEDIRRRLTEAVDAAGRGDS